MIAEAEPGGAVERQQAAPSGGRRLVGPCLLALLVAGGVAAAWIGRPARAPEAPSAGEATAPASAPAAELAPVATDEPGFDLVRVDRSGAGIVAGTAAPGAAVTVTAGGQVLAEARADTDGNFVASFTAPPGAEPHRLRLAAVAPDGSRSESSDMVMLLPPAPAAATATAVAAAGAAAEAASGPAGAAPAAAPGAVAGASAPTAAAPTVSQEPAATAQGAQESAAGQPAADGGATPVGAASAELAAAAPGASAGPRARPQPGAGPALGATVVVRDGAIEAIPADAAPGRQVALAAISYGEAGGVTIEGLGSPGSQVRAYVDGSLAQEGTVGGDGRWSLPLDAVAQGVYRLRIDALDGAGRVASRVETPFQRDFPRLPPPRPGEPGDGVLTVQPGNNLWTIARTHLGSGVLYTQIFTANRDLIRDPNLIYPGQILALPEAAAAASR